MRHRRVAGIIIEDGGGIGDNAGGTAGGIGEAEAIGVGSEEGWFPLKAYSEVVLELIVLSVAFLFRILILMLTSLILSDRLFDPLFPLLSHLLRIPDSILQRTTVSIF